MIACEFAGRLKVDRFAALPPDVWKASGSPGDFKLNFEASPRIGGVASRIIKNV